MAEKKGGHSVIATGCMGHKERGSSSKGRDRPELASRRRRREISGTIKLITGATREKRQLAGFPMS